MSCQSCQMMWRSCSNPVHIDHQYWRKGAHAGVKQWPLWDGHSLHSFHSRKGSDQWRVCPLQFWESLSLADTWDLVFGWALVADAAVLKLTGILYLSGVSCLFRFRARMSRALSNFCHTERKQALVITCASSMFCQPCQLMGRSCSNPVHIDHQYWRKGAHAGVSQWPLWENHSLPSFH